MGEPTQAVQHVCFMVCIGDSWIGDFNVNEISFADGSCVDGALIARGFWRVACGRVQVMCPACFCGHMTP